MKSNRQTNSQISLLTLVPARYNLLKGNIGMLSESKNVDSVPFVMLMA